MTVPFLDLKRQYHNHRAELDAAIGLVVESGAFIGGAHLSSFELAFARALGVNHCIGVGNGTDALYIAMMCLGIGPGDEVIVPCNSWISTSETVSQTGAQVVFADVDEDHFSIDPSDIERKLTPQTKAIVPVHFHGNVADMRAVMKIASKHDLLVIEDCAQAHFAQFDGKHVGTFGHAATFSFYPGKNLGAYGDGGAVVTDDPALADRITRFARHGALNKYDHRIEGINSRLDALQAAVLNVKLRHIHEWTESRRRNASMYMNLLANTPRILLPQEREACRHVYHLFVIRCLGQRDELMAHLLNKGISCMLHYPVMLPMLDAYRHLGHSEQDFPVASKHQREILSLPMFPELRTEEIQHVCTAINDFYGK